MGIFDISLSYGWGKSHLLNQQLNDQIIQYKKHYRVYRLSANYMRVVNRFVGIQLGVSYNYQKESIRHQTTLPTISNYKGFISYKASIIIQSNNAFYPFSYERYNGYNLIGTSFRFPIIPLNRIRLRR